MQLSGVVRRSPARSKGMTMISAAAATSRESARRRDGKFGEQPHREAGTDGQLGLLSPSARQSLARDVAQFNRNAPTDDVAFDAAAIVEHENWGVRFSGTRSRPIINVYDLRARQGGMGRHTMSLPVSDVFEQTSGATNTSDPERTYLIHGWGIKNQTSTVGLTRDGARKLRHFVRRYAPGHDGLTHKIDLNRLSGMSEADAARASEDLNRLHGDAKVGELVALYGARCEWPGRLTFPHSDYPPADISEPTQRLFVDQPYTPQLSAPEDPWASATASDDAPW